MAPVVGALAFRQPGAEPFRFVLAPPANGRDLGEGPKRLEVALAGALARRTEVSVASSYGALEKDLLAGRVDAAWAPPFACARWEAMGSPVLLRQVRKGRATYRGAILGRSGDGLELGALSGKRVVWVDRHSAAGFLLPAACLRERGVDPGRVFVSQEFLGSYRACLEAVASGRADVTSVFASVDGEPRGLTEVWPEKAHQFAVLALTQEVPNAGVAVAACLSDPLEGTLERLFLDLSGSEDGRALLSEVFHADGFEKAPRLGYRALYRVALAGL